MSDHNNTWAIISCDECPFAEVWERGKDSMVTCKIKRRFQPKGVEYDIGLYYDVHIRPETCPLPFTVEAVG